MRGTRAITLLAALTLLGAVTAGCQTPYERLDEMQDAVAAEQVAYQAFWTAFSAQDNTFNQWDHEHYGDTHYDELAVWRAEIEVLQTEVESFARWVNQVAPGPNADSRLQERRDSVDAGFLEEIRDELNANWTARPSSIDYDKAPPWYLEFAQADGDVIVSAWADIAGDHAEAFDLLSDAKRSAEFASSLSLTVTADDTLYDTSEECRLTFEDYAALKYVVDYESHLCVDYGLELLCDVSGFQVDTILLWEILEDAGQNAPDFFPGTWNPDEQQYEHVGRSACYDVVEVDAIDELTGEPIVQYLPEGPSGLFTSEDGVKRAISEVPITW